MTIVTRTDFPRKVKEVENFWIPMSDGVKLAARMFIPTDAEKNPVPAVLEYLPYRKRDGTHVRDALTHPYLAGHGYAAIRVDMRGNGDSDGLMQDEYTKQEQDDALEVIAWIARQKWCTGKVGMFGISWGGFNALQVAARKPPAKAQRPRVLVALGWILFAAVLAVVVGAYALSEQVMEEFPIHNNQLQSPATIVVILP